MTGAAGQREGPEAPLKLLLSLWGAKHELQMTITSKIHAIRRNPHLLECHKAREQMPEVTQAKEKFKQLKNSSSLALFEPFQLHPKIKNSRETKRARPQSAL
jgi:hypothetical protein